MPDGSLFCPNCGAKIASSPMKEPIKPFSETEEKPLREPIKPFSETVETPVNEPIKPFSETVKEPVRESIKPFSETVQTPATTSEPIVAPTPAVELKASQKESKKGTASHSYETDILNKPISVLGYIGIFLLMCIPLVNLILLFVWAFSKDTNKNKKNFAIASLIMIVVWIVLSIVLSVVFGAAMYEMIEFMSY
jgi:uncharacterized Zn finger protein (UPF0148 family)